MTRIAPSVLSADFLRLGEEAAAAASAGADLLHVDVMDGVFVPNITIGPPVVKALSRATQLPLDVHLMIDRPERYVTDFVQAGAAYLTVHEEATVHLHRTVQQIKEAGARAGVAINPATPVETLADVLADLDLVLIMSVNPGFGGQAFIPQVLNKIVKLRRMLDEIGSKAVIEVDGGVKPDNARQVVEAGADMLVMGSAFYGSDDYAGVIRKTRENLGE